MIRIVPLYATALALMFAVLSISVIRARRDLRVSIGDGGDRMLLRRQRVHANFAEYVPLILIMMMLVEFEGAPMIVVHVIGTLLVVGRVVHAYALSRDPEPPAMRAIGMGLTLSALLIASATSAAVAI